MSSSLNSTGSKPKLTSKGKRLPPPGSQFKKAKPCQSADDVAKLQSSTLISAVNECKVAEERRLHSLARAPTKARAAELEERHDRERARERERIEMLFSELNAVKTISGEGGLNAAERKRSSLLPVKTMDANRFDQENMRQVHEKWIDRLDTLERQFEARGRPRYNEYDERKKVALYHCTL